MSEAKEKSVLSYQLLRRGNRTTDLRYLLADLIEHIEELETIWFHITRGRGATNEDLKVLRELEKIIKLESEVIRLVLDVLKTELQK